MPAAAAPANASFGTLDPAGRDFSAFSDKGTFPSKIGFDSPAIVSGTYPSVGLVAAS